MFFETLVAVLVALTVGALLGLFVFSLERRKKFQMW